MRALVVYDSVSISKVTKQVAEVIGNALREKGVEADTKYCKEVEKATVSSYDVVIAGGPTMAFRPSRDIGQFLDALKGTSFSGKKAAAFDTQLQSKLSGNAAKGIQTRLEEMGFTIFKPILVVYVESKEKDRWQMKAGEPEKVKRWAEEAGGVLKV